MSNLEHGKKKTYYKKKEYPQQTMEELQGKFENMVNLFWGNNPYVKDISKDHELEVRFGTKGIKPLSKNDYDNVIQKLKSLGFTCPNEQGSYMLRIQNEYQDTTGQFRSDSNIRTEINGFHGIQEYCKHNDIRKLMSYDSGNNDYNVIFCKKDTYKNGEEWLKPVDFRDFNFRVSYQTEQTLNQRSGIIRNILEQWDKTKKSFRYINRVSFVHPDIPIRVDISITKSSDWDKKTNQYVTSYTTQDSNIFSKSEVYEIELEVKNSEIGPATSTKSAISVLSELKKVIKYVLMGLQGTNYPISYTEQNGILTNYMKLIMGQEYDAEKHNWIRTSNFIGPNSYTLQVINIAPVNPDSNIPNIRNDYTVTDKADGDRHLMYISEKGRIYLINTNMQVIFTGSVTENKDIFNSLIDGELILHDENGKFINLFAAFDIYFINKTDVRTYGFVPRKVEDSDNILKFRLPLLKNLFRLIKAVSVVNKEDSPIKFECKRFYPVDPKESIFSACNTILSRAAEKGFGYKTDGLIFTPASMGVGSYKIGHAGPLKKTTWDYSFKWKPPQYNTIDFLVKTIKTPNGTDEVTPMFQSGINTSEMNQLKEYKKVILCVGYDPTQHGYENPCQDVLDNKLPKFKGEDNEELYKPAEFVPTNPSEPGTGVANILLKKDSTDINQMFTEEGEVFRDDTIVEFRYDMNGPQKWNWVPLRMRYDKTVRYKQGANEFGNAYNVANSNWQSIHNPITADMISTGDNIPTVIADYDVYYNRIGSSDKTRGLRDFHNLFVKKKLIVGVSRKDDILIDYACGKGGDFPKWIDSKLSFVFGIDVSKDNLENRKDGACARFLNFKRDFKTMPNALFVHGNSSANIKNGTAMLNDKAVQITKAIFGEGTKGAAEKIGAAVGNQFGRGEHGFNISSCQFALHYFFESRSTFQNFIRNISECTKIGGYFIGACYDGQTVFNMLKKKDVGQSVELYDGDYKIWEIRKEYESEEFMDDISSIGYKISVYQESINKMFPEFLVNFAYLERVMEDYGFKLVTREEAKDLRLPDGSGMFSELYNIMSEEVKRNRTYDNEYKAALNMTALEKKISFLNRYFVYKKLRNVNAEKVTLDQLDEDAEQEKERAIEKATPHSKKEPKKKETKPKENKKRVKKIPGILLLEDATSSTQQVVEEPEAAVPEEVVPEEVVPKEPESTTKKTKKPKKFNLTLDE